MLRPPRPAGGRYAAWSSHFCLDVASVEGSLTDPGDENHAAESRGVEDGSEGVMDLLEREGGGNLGPEPSLGDAVQHVPDGARAGLGGR